MHVDEAGKKVPALAIDLGNSSWEGLAARDEACNPFATDEHSSGIDGLAAAAVKDGDVNDGVSGFG